MATLILLRIALGLARKTHHGFHFHGYYFGWKILYSTLFIHGSKCDCAIQLRNVWGCFQVYISSSDRELLIVFLVGNHTGIGTILFERRGIWAQTTRHVLLLKSSFNGGHGMVLTTLYGYAAGVLFYVLCRTVRIQANNKRCYIPPPSLPYAVPPVLQLCGPITTGRVQIIY